jgi:hypothetical protein
MKRQKLTALILGLVLTVLTVVSGSAKAQAANLSGAVTMNISFDFYVGDKKMEAGIYQIQQTSDKIFLIRNTKTKATILVATLGLVGEGSDVKLQKIVFNRYGKQYFLSEIYNRQQTEGHSIGNSKTERLAKERLSESDEHLSQTKVQPEKVEVKATIE